MSTVIVQYTMLSPFCQVKGAKRRRFFLRRVAADGAVGAVANAPPAPSKPPLQHILTCFDYGAASSGSDAGYHGAQHPYSSQCILSRIRWQNKADVFLGY